MHRRKEENGIGSLVSDGANDFSQANKPVRMVLRSSLDHTDRAHFASERVYRKDKSSKGGRRKGSSPLINLQRLLDTRRSSHPCTAHDHLARKPGVASQLRMSCGSPQTISPLRPAVTSSSSDTTSMFDDVEVNAGSETVMARGGFLRSWMGAAPMSSPMRSDSSSQGSKCPSCLIRLSRNEGKGKRLIQKEWCGCSCWVRVGKSDGGMLGFKG
jgi:hypothetical protein